MGELIITLNTCRFESKHLHVETETEQLYLKCDLSFQINIIGLGYLKDLSKITQNGMFSHSAAQVIYLFGKFLLKGPNTPEQIFKKEHGLT